MAGEEQDPKKSKKGGRQTPRGGRPRETKDGQGRAPGKKERILGSFTEYANDPLGLGNEALGVADFRGKRYQGGTAETFVGGRGVDMSQTENRNFVSATNRHERAMARRMMNAKEEDWDIARKEEKDRRWKERQDQRKKMYADRNFDNAVFSTREGWANLGRTSGVDADGKAVTYGRGASGVKNYQERYDNLKYRADQLSGWLKEGDFAGRGKEWAEIRKEVARTHANGGLTEKQLEGIERKMDSILAERNERADRANRLQAFYAKKSLQEQRQKLGDVYGILSDEQVKSMSDRQKWDNIRKASDAYLASVNQKDDAGNRIDPDTKVMGFTKSGDFGTVSRGGDRVKAMQDLLDNGVSLTAMARMAVQSGDKKWLDSYQKIMSSQDGDKRGRAVESLGHAYLRSMLDKGDEGVKALRDAITKDNTVSGRPNNGPNKILSFKDRPPEADIQQARKDAEDAKMFEQGATKAEVEQPGPTVKRADQEVQDAGAAAMALSQAGELAPKVPKAKDVLSVVPGSHQSDGSMGELTPLRAAGLPDIEANAMDVLEKKTGPLPPRNTPPVEEKKTEEKKKKESNFGGPAF